MQLKRFQKKSITQFEEYLILIKNFDAAKPHKIAFLSLTDHSYNEHGLDNVPIVCIKIPTGGGKTIVACHMLHSIFEKYIQSKNEFGLVMWLVPTDAIRNQTLLAFKDRSHPYRETLDRHFSNNVKIFNFKESLLIKKTDLEENICIIVATFGAFRIKDREGRKAYNDNGGLIEHFQNIDIKNLHKDENGQIKYSLMNVIKISHPIIIIDEGHHTKTELSIDMIKEMNPSFVLEFTATPRPESNVLVNITAAELKEEKMVKIPIYLTNIGQWQQTIRQGTSKRNELEQIAKREESEYIRPIALIQAEQEKEDDKRIHVKKIFDFLIEEGVDEKEIAIKTGKQDQITGLNLFSRNCPIRYIITVSALKEGWDNSFAYVLITVANMSSKISVEQTIGRILRLSHTKEKKNEELNVSYVYTSSRLFSQAAKELERGLLANGYTKKDIRRLGDDGISKTNTYKKIIADNDIKIPFIAIKEDEYRPLEFFEHLIGPNFNLAKQEIDENFELYYDQDRLQKIDVKEGDQLTRSVQKKLKIAYDFKYFTENDLLNWLDKKVLRKEYSQEEKREFFEKMINNLLATKRHSLSELSKNCYRLKEVIELQINKIEVMVARKKFEALQRTGKLSLNSIFFNFPSEIEIDDPLEDNFEKHLFEKSGILNSEELDLALKIDQIENVKWWYRNREKKDFYIQGWRQNKFYPDFILKTNSEKYIVIEYKGENILTNEDTEYKADLGNKWVQLTENRYKFFIAHKNNLEDIINEIQKT
jgi:type III restriction enzyme